MSLILENGLIINQGGGGGGSGDIIGASNIGNGASVFSSKNGSTLEFRTIKGAGAVDVVVSGNEVRVSGNAGLRENESIPLDITWAVNTANFYGGVFADQILYYDANASPPQIQLGDLNASNQLGIYGVNVISNNPIFGGSIQFSVNGNAVFYPPLIPPAISGMALISSSNDGNTEWVEILSKVKIEEQYNKKPEVVNVNSAIEVSAGLRNTVIFVSGSVELTIQDSGWTVGDTFNIITTISGVTIVPGAGITLSYSGSASTATIDKPFEAVGFVARTPTQFYAIGKLG